MTYRVSTFTTTTNLFDQTQRLQSNYARANAQTATGLKSETFDGISGDAQQLLAINGEVNNLTAQAIVIKAAQTRVNGLQNIVGSIADTINQANSLLSSVLGGIDISGGATANVAQAKVIRDALTSLLNSQVGGRYLFGGNVTDVAPVNINAAGYTPASAPGTATTAYYQGDSAVETAYTSTTMSISYGVTANNPAFEKALRALTIYIANPTDTATAQQAFDLVKAAASGVGDIVGGLTAKANILDNEASINGAASDYLNRTISGLRDVDTAQAAVNASQLETQLQASYSSLSKLLNLRLSDFLK